LAEFEGSIETAEGNVADDTKRALALVLPGNRAMPNIVLNRATCRRAINLVCLYRLVDILHVLHGPKVRQGENPHYNRLSIAIPMAQARVSQKITYKCAFIHSVTGLAHD